MKKIILTGLLALALAAILGTGSSARPANDAWLSRSYDAVKTDTATAKKKAKGQWAFTTELPAPEDPGNTGKLDGLLAHYGL